MMVVLDPCLRTGVSSPAIYFTGDVTWDSNNDDVVFISCVGTVASAV